jgi:hypothetical protein
MQIEKNRNRPDRLIFPEAPEDISKNLEIPAICAQMTLTAPNHV